MVLGTHEGREHVCADPFAEIDRDLSLHWAD
jgi:hypothetical protein